MSFVLSGLMSCSDGVTIYVAPSSVVASGEDRECDGLSISTPVTIDRGIAIAAEEYNRGEDVNIVMLDGRYNRESTLDITDNLFKRDSLVGGSLTISPLNEEAVNIVGGIQIDREEILSLSESDSLGRFNSEIIQNIRAVDLSMVNIGPLKRVGFAHPYLPSWTEIFIDGEPMSISRWPNEGDIKIGAIIDAGSVPRHGDYSNRGGCFNYTVDRPNSWIGKGELWISGYFSWGYADDMVKIAKIDTVNREFTTVQPTMYGFKTGADFRRWHALNLLCEIDKEGEYAIDFEHEKLYFYPPSTINGVEISILEEPLVAIINVDNVTLDGITFSCSRDMGLYMERTNSVVVQNSIFTNLGSAAVVIGRGVEPFKELKHAGSGTPASRKIGSFATHRYDNVTFNRLGGTNSGVRNCKIYNVGAGGVHLSGGDRVTLEEGNNFVENCEIYNFNRIERSYRAGVDISGVGNRVSNCEIYSAPSMAILLHGNEHTIELNDIHNVCNDIDDQGAIYYGRDPSERGNLLQYNYFHDIDAPHRSFIIYHDDGACDLTVKGNIVNRVGTDAALIGGGSDNSYMNNIFINTDSGIRIGNRLQTWGKGMIARGGIFEERLNEVKYKEAPYSIKYPHLAQYFEEDCSAPLRNSIEHNLFIDIDSPLSGDKSYVTWGENFDLEDIESLKGVDVETLGLKKLEISLKDNNHFNTIPFSSIGLKR